MTSIDALTAALVEAMAGQGPSVLVAKVDESAPVARPSLDYVFLKERFMKAMGVTEEPAPSAHPSTGSGRPELVEGQRPAPTEN